MSRSASPTLDDAAPSAAGRKNVRVGTIHVGTAGWSVPTRYADLFPAGGAHLERYAALMTAVEINSSFYRHHQRKTYERWASATPDDFRFAVKMPKAVTHGARLTGAEDILDRFLDEALGLGRKLGPLLVQLPPSLLFDAPIVTHFLGMLRSRHAGDIACEPRHASWFAADADALLASHRVARVAADPAAGSPLAARPGGWQGLTYLRLHGSPRIYRSAYEPVSLKAAASTLRAGAEAGDAWCILDNTAEFAALGDALALKTLITDP